MADYVLADVQRTLLLATASIKLLVAAVVLFTFPI